MKAFKVVYPGFKRDRDGRFTEIKVVLAEVREFIGRKMSVTDKPHEEIREHKRKHYLTF